MSNIVKIQKMLTERGIDALLLTEPRNRFYATGFMSSDGAVLVTREGSFFFTDSRYIEAARMQVTDSTVGEITVEVKMPDLVSAELERCAATSIGMEEESLSYDEFLRLAEKLPAEAVRAQNIMKTLRASKSPQEAGKMKAAQRIAEKALDEVLGLMRPGMTERDVAAELIYRMLKNGADGMSFDPIVVTGKKSSMPHGKPGDEIICRGDFVTMDFGCVKDGYCSDMTRTVAIGAVTDEMRRVYDTVLTAQLAGIEKAACGVPGKDIDAAARQVIEAAGYGEFFGHSFGHSLGLEVHEGPNASPTEARMMPVGAVISAEPGIYLPGRFGVRIEDVLYLGENGTENIMNAAKNLIIL